MNSPSDDEPPQPALHARRVGSIRPRSPCPTRRAGRIEREMSAPAPSSGKAGTHQRACEDTLLDDLLAALDLAYEPSDPSGTGRRTLETVPSPNMIL